VKNCARSLFCFIFLAVSVLPLLAEKVPVGVMTYEGETPDGSSVFRIILNPPAGVTIDNLTPAFFTNGTGHSFTFPDRQASPPLYNFLFLTVPDSGFASCPCKSASFMFSAKAGTRVRFNGKNSVVDRTSVSILDPLPNAQVLAPQQSGTIYLDTAGHKTEHN
jgi:hypothetical protein